MNFFSNNNSNIFRNQGFGTETSSGQSEKAVWSPRHSTGSGCPTTAVYSPGM
ncbi:hypothetical protein M378DRAFT_161816, partial [Amanita muscaria Koide BX008]